MTKELSNKPLNELSKDEAKVLNSETTKIRNGLKNFVVIGRSHDKIKDIVVKAYDTFEQYINDRLGISKQAYYRHVNAYEVYSVLEKAGCKVLPHAESVIRPLTNTMLIEKYGLSSLLADTNSIYITVWNQCIDRIKEQGKPKVTAQTVAKEYQKFINSHIPEVEQPKLPAKQDNKATKQPNTEHQSKRPTLSMDQLEKAVAHVNEPREKVNPDTGLPEETQSKNTKGSKDTLKEENNRLRSELEAERLKSAQLFNQLKKVRKPVMSPLAKKVWEVGYKHVQAELAMTQDEEGMLELTKIASEVGV